MKQVALILMVWVSIQVYGQVGKNTITDEIVFGNDASEKARDFNEGESKSITGGLGNQQGC